MSGAQIKRITIDRGLWKDVLTDFHAISWTDNFLTQAGFTSTQESSSSPSVFLHLSFPAHWLQGGRSWESYTNGLFNGQAQPFCARIEASILWNISTIFWGKWHRTLFVTKSWVNFLGREISTQNIGSYVLKRYNYLEVMRCCTCSKKHEYIWQSLTPKK